ncbi:MAG: DUF1289 domain-containing protein [Rhodobacteraceae bacterium]|nr:DUF1289 domain-containing protein [Paracoccaceae bacterium]
MTDDVWKRAEPDSPCVKLCVIHPKARICMGCFRSLEEIASWGSLDTDARRSLMAELPARASQVKGRRR